MAMAVMSRAVAREVAADNTRGLLPAVIGVKSPARARSGSPELRQPPVCPRGIGPQQSVAVWHRPTFAAGLLVIDAPASNWYRCLKSPSKK